MPPEPGRGLLIDREVRAQAVVLAARGEVDATTSTQMRRQLREASSAGRPLVVLDLSEVRFMDSPGLGALVSGLRAVREAGCRFRLVCPRGNLFRLLQVTQIARVIESYLTLEEALAAPGEPSLAAVDQDQAQ